MMRLKCNVLQYGFEGEIIDSLATGFRNIDDAEGWAPQMDILSNEELEKILIAQERSIRYGHGPC
jgi:hypothetical protein